ncbi:MAG: hypothetical protein OEZ00_00540 [Dehalococcoidia bacterium]|nr:hypothetical protein [Dehalococcoidia bacterium]
MLNATVSCRMGGGGWAIAQPPLFGAGLAFLAMPGIMGLARE